MTLVSRDCHPGEHSLGDAMTLTLGEFDAPRPSGWRRRLLSVAIPSLGGRGADSDTLQPSVRLSREELLEIFGGDLGQTRQSSAPRSSAPRSSALTDSEHRQAELASRLRTALYPRDL
jgi:hypothetical protein